MLSVSPTESGMYVLQGYGYSIQEYMIVCGVRGVIVRQLQYME